MDAIDNADSEVLREIKKSPEGTPFFIEDFLEFGNYKAVAKALERLVDGKELTRIARGMYARITADSVESAFLPDPEDVANAICRKYHVRVIPTGPWALYELGLSDEEPKDLEYLTDGVTRRFYVGNRRILFRHTSQRYLSAIGPVSSLVIQALRAIGRERLTREQVALLLKKLKKESQYNLDYDIRLAPEWIREILRMAVK